MSTNPMTTNRVPLVAAADLDDHLRITIQERLGGRTDVPNLYRTLANAPAMLDAWLGFAWKLRNDATSARSTRELIILRIAQLLDAPYEWHHHLGMAAQAGVTQAQIGALAGWATSGEFAALDRAALRMAEEQTVTGAASAEVVAELRALSNDEVTVELVLTAAFYNCVARVLNSLGVPLET